MRGRWRLPCALTLAAALALGCAPQPAVEAPVSDRHAQLDRLHRDVPGLESRQTDRGIVLTLGPGVKQLDRVAAFLRDAPEQRVVVEGFTDRALAVRDALVAQGVEAERIEARGPSAQQLDGRIELVLPHGREGAAAGR
ncbi:MAG TPA: hypothetical protein VM489_07500 [Burkholderiales bacterium]|nr:hypothetical protein [Burkholderiales bacterium]